MKLVVLYVLLIAHSISSRYVNVYSTENIYLTISHKVNKKTMLGYDRFDFRRENSFYTLLQREHNYLSNDTFFIIIGELIPKRL